MNLLRDLEGHGASDDEYDSYSDEEYVRRNDLAESGENLKTLDEFVTEVQ